MELPQSNTIIPAWQSKVLQPYAQDQLKPQIKKLIQNTKNKNL